MKDVGGGFGQAKEREEALEFAFVPLIGDSLSHILDLLTIDVIGGTLTGDVLAVVTGPLSPNTTVSTLPI